MGNPKPFSMHTADKTPSFQSSERRGIAMGTYWADAVGSHGSVLVLYRGLYRLQTAGSVCWCNTDHQKDLFCRQASIMLPLFLSSVIVHHSYLQLVYSMHRFPSFFFFFPFLTQVKITVKAEIGTLLFLYIPLKSPVRKRKIGRWTRFSLWLEGTRYTSYPKWVRMKFSETFHAGSVLLQSMSAVNPPLIEKKLIHTTLQRHKRYTLFVAKLFPSPLHHKKSLWEAEQFPLSLFWWSREDGGGWHFVALPGEPKPHLSGSDPSLGTG